MQFEEDATQILDYLYIGSVDNAKNRQLLDKLQIKCVLNVSAQCENYFPTDFEYHHCKIEDSWFFDITPFIAECVAFIDKAKENKKNILVHCNSGASRSPTIVTAYFIEKMGFSLHDALEFIKQKRPMVIPNPAFVAALIKHEKKLKGKNSINLKPFIIAMLPEQEFDILQRLINFIKNPPPPKSVQPQNQEDNCLIL